jgi:mannosyltransferase
VTQSPPAGVDGDSWKARAAPAVWAVPAVVTFLLCLPSAWHAVLWQDELATYSAVSRPVPDLFRLLLHRDSVHGLYYLLVQAVTFGHPGPLTVRLPALVGAGVWAGLVAVLGTRLGGRRVGAVAGLLVAVLPAVSRFGAEARPYTLAAAAAAGCTLVFLWARERGGRRAWAWYAATVVLTGYLQLTAVFVVGAHALVVAYLWHQDRDRRLVRAWAGGAAAAAVVLAPLVLLAARQSSELGLIPAPTWRTALLLPVVTFFGPTVGALVIGLAWPALARRDLRAVLLAGYALVPPAGLVLVSLHTSMMRPRYLLFTVAAWALAAALALVPLGTRAALGGLLVVALVGLPQLVDQVSTTRNGQPDYRTMARVLQAQVRPGDAMVLPQARGIRFRIGLQAYLPPERRPADVLAVQAPVDVPGLDAGTCDPAACLGTPPRIWVGCVGACTDPLASMPPATRSVLAARGYRTDRTWAVSGGAMSVLRRP